MTIFNTFHNQVEFGMISEGLQNFGGGGLRTPPPKPPRYATATQYDCLKDGIPLILY